MKVRTTQTDVSFSALCTKYVPLQVRTYLLYLYQDKGKAIARVSPKHKPTPYLIQKQEATKATPTTAWRGEHGKLQDIDKMHKPIGI